MSSYGLVTTPSGHVRGGEVTSESGGSHAVRSRGSRVPRDRQGSTESHGQQLSTGSQVNLPDDSPLIDQLTDINVNRFRQIKTNEQNVKVKKKGKGKDKDDNDFQPIDVSDEHLRLDREIDAKVGTTSGDPSSGEPKGKPKGKKGKAGAKGGDKGGDKGGAKPLDDRSSVDSHGTRRSRLSRKSDADVPLGNSLGRRNSAMSQETIPSSAGGQEREIQERRRSSASNLGGRRSSAKIQIENDPPKKDDPKKDAPTKDARKKRGGPKRDDLKVSPRRRSSGHSQTKVDGQPDADPKKDAPTKDVHKKRDGPKRDGSKVCHSQRKEDDMEHFQQRPGVKLTQRRYLSPLTIAVAPPKQLLAHVTSQRDRSLRMRLGMEDVETDAAMGRRPPVTYDELESLPRTHMRTHGAQTMTSCCMETTQLSMTSQGLSFDVSVALPFTPTPILRQHPTARTVNQGVVQPVRFATAPPYTSPGCYGGGVKQAVGVVMTSSVPARASGGVVENRREDLPTWVSPLYKTYGIGGPYGPYGPFQSKACDVVRRDTVMTCRQGECWWARLRRWTRVKWGGRRVLRKTWRPKYKSWAASPSGTKEQPSDMTVTNDPTDEVNKKEFEDELAKNEGADEPSKKEGTGELPKKEELPNKEG